MKARALWSGGAAIARTIEREVVGWELPPLDVAFSETPISADPLGTWCRRCGQTVGAGEVTQGGCGSCRGRYSPIDRTTRLCEYGGGVAQRVLQTKHGRWFAMAFELGARLGEQVLATRCDDALPAVVVPIPMPSMRRLGRGIDHAHEIARGVAAVIGRPLARPLRQSAGGTQVGRSPTERRLARSRFHLHFLPPWRPIGLVSAVLRGHTWRLPSSVLLVDDVRTTGSTLEQAARILRDLGVSTIEAAVVAVASAPSRRHAASRSAGTTCE